MLCLERLSIAFQISAEGFFQACVATWSWQHLQVLALTSPLLRHAESSQELDTLLYEAWTVAERMPALRTLVLWYGITGNACAFTYRAGGRQPSITWRRTWEMDWSARVVEVWQRVACQRQPGTLLRVKKEQVLAVIHSQSDAIHHLDLPYCVVASANLGPTWEEQHS